MRADRREDMAKAENPYAASHKAFVDEQRQTQEVRRCVAVFVGGR